MREGGLTIHFDPSAVGELWAFGKDAILVLLGAILGVVLPTCWASLGRHRKFGLTRAVFPLSPSTNGETTIHVRASLDEINFGQNPATLRAYTPACDMRAVMSVVEHFKNLPAEPHFDYFPDVKPDMKNVVLVGLSHRSEVSRETANELERLGYRVASATSHAYFSDNSGQEFRCSHGALGDNTIVIEDAGVIYRRQTQAGADILTLGGLHGFGTQAAAIVALSEEFQRRVRKRRLRHFIQFVRVNVKKEGPEAGIAIVHDSIQWRELPLINLEGK